jgi:stage V sporulation protein R
MEPEMESVTPPVDRQPLSENSEWTFELLDTYEREIARVAAHYGLDTYPNQIEVITSEQMIDAYSSVGMPVGYHHWSYGKQFLSTQKGYKRGQMGLAYEIVINSSPCIAKLSMAKEQVRQTEREAYLQSQVNDLWRTLPAKPETERAQQDARFPSEPQENLLYFIEKNAPRLAPWQREIVRIVRKIAQYFYPQRQTQVMNEGWATFWHYTLLNHLYEEGKLTDGFMMEFLQSHTNVVYQPPFNSRYYNGINPYALGFAMFQDLRRICEHPTEEDRRWFPELAGSNWVQSLDFAMRNFKDESFIAQYLSPKLIRDFKLFAMVDDDSDDKLEVSAIHDEAGYRAVRQQLADHYNLGNREPNIQVYAVDVFGDRSLTLRHYMHDRRPLGETTPEMLRHIARLWGYTVRIESVDQEGVARQAGISEV